MYPELQSAFLAEASAPLILLGGAILLYRSFREKYLLPWIAGWAVYTLAKLFLAVSLAHDQQIWPALANVAFVATVTLFAAAIFYYVYRPRLLIRVSFLILGAMLLGVCQALWPAHANVLLFFFGICCWLIAGVAAWQLFTFARGRGNTGTWILSFTLLLLFQHHPALAYGILVDVLLGISMMMIVLDDSRVQNSRLDILNRLSQVVSSPDNFLSIVTTTLLELKKVSGAKSSWFRVLEDGKLRLAAQHGLAETLAEVIGEVEASGTTGGQLLEHGEVGALRCRNMSPAMKSAFLEHGFDHIVIVPVIGKNTRIGVLVLGMQHQRYYTDNDRDFLKAAATQLGLAAENRRLVQQLVRSVHDLTETKAAEERYKTLFEHMQEGVFVSLPEGRLLDCNEAFVHMMGYSSKEELFQVDVGEALYVAPEDRQRFVALMEQHGFVRNFELTLKRRDGSQISVIESSFATRNANGTQRYQGVVLDITEKKKAENEIHKLYEETRKAYDDLRRAQEQLLQSEKMSAVGRLISGVAHELNNPLTAISGYTQLLESEKLDSRLEEFVRKLHKQTDRAQRIVQNLLSFSRQHKPQRIYVDLRHVIEDTIALRDFEIKTHGIVLERIFDEVLPSVVADPHQLEQVFLNIINNAVDAMLETARSGVLRIRIFSQDANVICEFHDSGPGMTDPKHVFDPFYTTKSVGKGTGLGLSICYGIVKEHGGEIAAYNHAQGGAVVRVRLPEALGEKPMSEGERILARRGPQVQGRVLLVDAEEVIEFEREILVAAGLDVAALSSGKRAIEALEQAAFDIVLLDSHAAGEVNSERVLNWIRKSQPEMAGRVVLMLPPAANVGSRSFVNADRILCFVKPFEASPLLSTVRRVLRASRAAVGD